MINLAIQIIIKNKQSINHFHEKITSFTVTFVNNSSNELSNSEHMAIIMGSMAISFGIKQYKILC